jgi:hypothetical protein
MAERAKPLTRTKQGKIPARVRKAITGTSDSVIDQKLLLSDILDCFGGTMQLAGAIYEEYQNAAPGSMVRTRTLEMIQRLVMANTAADLTDRRKASELSDEELEEIVTKFVSKTDREQEAPDVNGRQAEGFGRLAPIAGITRGLDGKIISTQPRPEFPSETGAAGS